MQLYTHKVWQSNDITQQKKLAQRVVTTVIKNLANSPRNGITSRKGYGREDIRIEAIKNI